MGADVGLLERVAAALAVSRDDDEVGPASLLAVTSEQYGVGPGAAGQPGLGPVDSTATALFEAVVESAFLVANADGVFDDAERWAFREIVLMACGGRVGERQLSALLADLETALSEDGLALRVAAVARCVRGPVEAREVLRVAALIAAVSGGVSAEERTVLGRLAVGLGLGPEDVELAVIGAERIIAGAPPSASGWTPAARASRPPSDPS